MTTSYIIGTILFKTEIMERRKNWTHITKALKDELPLSVGTKADALQDNT